VFLYYVFLYYVFVAAAKNHCFTGIRGKSATISYSKFYLCFIAPEVS